MHVSPAVLHLHFFAQVVSALQPHLISSVQLTAAAGRVVQTGHHPVSSHVHPKPSGLAAAVISFRLFLQILASCRRLFTLFNLVYCNAAAHVWCSLVEVSHAVTMLAAMDGVHAHPVWC